VSQLAELWEPTVNSDGANRRSRSTGPAAALQIPSQALQYTDPRDALTRCRLDVVLKYLFFRSLTGAGDRGEWENLYRRHIADRTKGIEPRDRFQKLESQKRSVDDYVKACEELLRSFQSAGFDPEHPVPLSSENKLLNGAHRMACALATQQPILVAPGQLGSSRPWGFQWFLDRNYPPEVLAALLYQYAHLTRKAIGVMILWGPTAGEWTRMMDCFKEQAGLVGWLDIDFENNPAAFESAVRDVYALQWVAEEDATIRRKTILLNQARRVFRVVLLEALPNVAAAFPRVLAALRSQVRSRVSHLIPEEAYCTCHASLKPAETRYLIELLLGAGSRKHLSLRCQGHPRKEFCQWLLQLPGELARHGLRRQDICIVGSSPLEVVGLRQATDIDITLSSRARQRFGAGITHLTDWLDIVTRNYARSTGHPPISDDQLIGNPQNHFWFRGWKFADLDIVFRRKAYQRRPKDLADLKLAEAFLTTRGLKGPWAGPGSRTELITYLVQREKELAGSRL